MINSYLGKQISVNFPHTPTPNQSHAIEILVDFLQSTQPNGLLLFKGYAGTGKTSLIGALVKTLTELKQKTVLLAPTGRAAKVFSAYANHKALTIHKKIYRQKTFSPDMSGFQLAQNLHRDTLFIVDEASMITNEGIDSHLFGEGRLLDDLIRYVYENENGRLILLGDTAQLPPVMQTESPALNRLVLQGYNLEVSEIQLTQVVRQADDSGILYNATRLRDALSAHTVEIFPRLRLGFADFRKINGMDLIEEISSAYYREGREETIVITRSNKRATIYNNGIRNRILDREEELSAGDFLMIAKNNYFWTEKEKIESMDFIANGDIVEVRRVRKTYEMYGFRFADVEVRFADYDLEMEIRILLDALQSEAPALTREENDRLLQAILEDYEDIPRQSDKMKQLKSDVWYNAVQVKYAYAITCHKAQGGQWSHVFLDIGYVTEEMLGENFYRWLYTAFTRATHCLCLVNLPKEFEEEIPAKG
ncbi:exodeoxyribonuclease-5 [Parabacteroides sp. PFB2-12]|uniref:ATP-dependent DNA helicase n=1 Tax=unclassified Parabacteroides TaxID=2649774 RepID=UPI002473F747|nr:MULTISPECIES: AAA family ATPase [unclassified Parabacteroides]MDH6343302.1 exodeoxyribonuclease-5 [Parabacteroides sp. PM6-13]MDH6390318.1 exodeoxyribonuclease-5 [Parabacteroides sp. PFB2-12]